MNLLLRDFNKHVHQRLGVPTAQFPELAEDPNHRLQQDERKFWLVKQIHVRINGRFARKIIDSIISRAFS